MNRKLLLGGLLAVAYVCSGCVTKNKEEYSPLTNPSIYNGDFNGFEKQDMRNFRRALHDLDIEGMADSIF